MGQYSSFCGCAWDLVLGGSDHTEDDDEDRGDEENGQNVEARERGKKGETTNDQTHHGM